ncbi:MAG TPA: hypothetical protein VLW85_09290 [Myxococcales bacterium]|nr:hypothetical protein [Myxococcales bacterium]
MQKFSGAPKDPDAGTQLPDSLQVESGQKIILAWAVEGADSVELTDPATNAPQTFDAKTSSFEVTPGSDTQTYSLVAISGSQRSDPKAVQVSTHPAGHSYSPHAQVLPPSQPPQIHFFNVGKKGSTTAATTTLDASPGDMLVFSWEVEGDVDTLAVADGDLRGDRLSGRGT